MIKDPISFKAKSNKKKKRVIILLAALTCFIIVAILPLIQPIQIIENGTLYSNLCFVFVFSINNRGVGIVSYVNVLYGFLYPSIACVVLALSIKTIWHLHVHSRALGQLATNSKSRTATVAKIVISGF